ncbi:unnamed protein product [Prorocentrum cordatum]|uniref:Uncharacterized protein n=1 Tax=Prorocentrum cordatum TaxID=2364126 RepID=A0ABN9TQJ7_9DINO|nr:unnamed protein product [Polarella glacialis]
MHRGIQADALDTPEASPTRASTADTAELGTDPDVRFVLFESDTDASAEDDPLEGFGGASSMLEQIQLRGLPAILRTRGAQCSPALAPSWTLVKHTYVTNRVRAI